MNDGSRDRVLALLAILLAAAASAGCGDIFGPDDGAHVPLVELPDSLEVLYTRDATRLAVRHVHATGHPAADSVNIPTALIESLRDAMVRVYAYEHPARDTAVERLRLRTFPRPALREALVALDTTVAWAARWWRNERPTGQPDVDTLIERYGLAVAESYDWSIGPYILVRSSAPLNVRALSDRLEAVEGVEHADPNSAGTDGSDLRAARIDGAWRLDYRRAWGDCPSGCIHERVWRFTVTDDGFVRYDGVSGDPLPDG